MSKFVDQLKKEHRDLIVKSYKEVFNKPYHKIVENVVDCWINEGNRPIDFERADWKSIMDDIMEIITIGKKKKKIGNKGKTERKKRKKK